LGELTTIGYSPGESALHRLDPRTKQALLVGISLVSVWGGFVFLATLSFLLLLSFRAAGLRVTTLLREIRYFLFFLLFVFAVRALTLEQSWIPSVSMQKGVSAMVVCWRLLSIVLMGILLVATTRTAHIRASMIWYLKPAPFVNEKMAATMVGMVVRFIPMILFRANEVSDVFRSRGIERRKKPLFRLISFTIALFRRVFLDADTFALAMQARCYDERRTVPALRFSRIDGMVVIGAMCLCLTLFLP